jgi:hypothetical protein
METALANARHALILHKEDPFNAGKTGIEPSLIGEFLNQMIELNKFIYTVASTNNPYNLVFQAMFIDGYVERSKLTDKFISALQERELSYFIRNFSTGEIIKYKPPGALERMLEYEKLNPYRLKLFEEELGYRHHPLSFIVQKPQWGPEINDHNACIEDQIKNGEIVELFVVNYNNPLDRSLYKILIALFSSQ